VSDAHTPESCKSAPTADANASEAEWLASEGSVGGSRKLCHVKCGEDLEKDARLKHLVERELCLLSVVIPRIRSVGDAVHEWLRRSASRSVVVSCIVVAGLHMTMAGICLSDSGHGVCAGGPDDAEEDLEAGRTSLFSRKAYIKYGPPMMNALATLLLSFYANVCFNLYSEGYLAAQALKESVYDLSAIAAGTIPARAHDVRMEFWRLTNLYHACTYVLADKSRTTYNLDFFFFPVAMAYGDWDGHEHLGMLRHHELSLLTTDPAAALRPAHMATSKRAAKTKSAERAEMNRQKREQDKEKLGKMLPQATFKTCTNLNSKWEVGKGRANRRPGLTPGGVMKGSIFRSHGSNMTLRARTSTEMASVASSDSFSLANSRGDAATNVAALHASIGVRLYQLVDLVIDAKLSRAAWPAWNAVCLKLRTNSEAVKQRALYRLPRTYQASVRFLVAATVLTDTLLLASHAARILRDTNATANWKAHAYFGAMVDFVLNLLLAWCLAVFLDCIGDMQTPFASELFDLPGLSYVCGAAELSLRMMQGGGGKGHPWLRQHECNRLFQLMNDPGDVETLLSGLPEEEAVLAKRYPEFHKGVKKEAEEEEEGDGGDE
jgi:hypothetical protein